MFADARSTSGAKSSQEQLELLRRNEVKSPTDSIVNSIGLSILELTRELDALSRKIQLLQRQVLNKAA